MPAELNINRAIRAGTGRKTIPWKLEPIVTRAEATITLLLTPSLLGRGLRRRVNMPIAIPNPE